MKDIEGMTFGKLTVIKVSGKNKWGNLLWQCQCSCGEKTIVASGNLNRNHTRSCSCLQLEVRTKHGLYKSRFRRIYRLLRNRCYNKNSPVYKMYGGRGIKSEWKSFSEFVFDMHELYTEHVDKLGEHNTTIDRKNNAGNYSKENCRWATRNEQANNKRNVKIYKGEWGEKSLAELARLFGLKRPTLYRRVVIRGMTIEKALFKPYDSH